MVTKIHVTYGKFYIFRLCKLLQNHRAFKLKLFYLILRIIKQTKKADFCLQKDAFQYLWR